MHPAPVFDVQRWIDTLPFSRFQLAIAVQCFAVVALDGLDTALIGFVVPALRNDWHTGTTGITLLLASGLVGLAVGAFFAGPLGDRVGRKRLLIASVLSFGLFSGLCAIAPEIYSLTAFRFLTGVGLGAAMPNAIAMTSEYSPRARRALIVTTMFCGFTFGSAAAGFVAAHVIPRYGWHAMFVIGGVLPIALGLTMLVALPESIRFLIHRRAPAAQIAAVLRRMSANAPVDSRHFVADEPAGVVTHSPVSQLLMRPLRFGTLTLWCTFWINLLVVYLVTNWLPSLFRDAGFDLAQAAIVTAMFQLGGTVGAILLGRAMDRFNPYAVLVAAYLVAMLCVSIVAWRYDDLTSLCIGIFGIGFGVAGSQTGANALAADFYPTSSRVTGVSWALGVGRLGAIAGSFIGALVMASAMGLSGVFTLLIAPIACAAVAIGTMGLHYTRTGRYTKAVE
ncbi:4-hydroxybenzoate transporter [Burkholderia diffusa]|uniref:4-hydroxybenzoate transporter n=1 Tax=Burkholderia diffusa TaxID=488732 RepID=A0AAW3P9N3_9BURK|nr:aromatic acid/H+ symport family MFS transporter [Burkholderia diffusa]KWF32769.1 4-hydroxybenzoate transporter [Burkholderia diffusa]KWF38693.1 4-hydroxybenzoate transporter [Burkholderia diffusa]KWF46738.1 4-hydroxybenzoate transporter [Burkholderia diffusa]KWF50691.1 4-hydroxybenzoate transporter [Burkholderia diffusa]